MKFILFTSMLFLVFSCANITKKNSSSLLFIPSSASVIIKTNNLKKLKSNFTNNTLYQNNKKHLLTNHFENIESLSVLKNEGKDVFICYSPTGENELAITLLTPVSNITLNTEELASKKRRTFNYLDQEYTEVSIKDKSYYATQLDSLWVATDNKLLIESNIKEYKNNKKRDTKLQESLQALDNDKSFSVLLNNNKVPDLFERLLPNLNSKNKKHLSGWSSGDFNIDSSTISFDGVYKPTDSIFDYTHIFNNSIAQRNELIRITPTKAKSITSYTYNNFEQLSRNLALYNDREFNFEADPTFEFIGETNEFGEIALDSKKLLAFTLLSEEIDIADYIDSDGTTETFRDISINKLTDPINFATELKPLTTIENASYYIQFYEFLIFGNDINSLKSIISSLKNEDILTENEWFDEFSDEIANESNILHIESIDEITKTLTNAVGSDYTSDFKKTNTKGYRLAALQLTADNNFTHLHYVVSKTKAAKIEGKVNQVANIFIDNEITNGPQLVKNHLTKGMDVLIQDASNQLTLLSSEGKILWQKNINTPILGRVQQMDMYRNGRKQLVFTTENALHVLDRKGKEVAPYPIKFETPVTQPVAIFDYDKNRKYRIAIVQNSTMSLYDQKGKKVTGFDFSNKDKGSINQVPKHIRVGSKDYILVNENTNGLHVLSRTGKERVKMKQKTQGADNNWFWYKNAFTSVTADNLITQVNTKGSVNKVKPIKNGDDIKIDATSKTLVTLTENTLTIKGKKINLDYGLYTAPKIFYINNKIFITTTDTQTSKVYLFDSNAKPISGFPIYGNSLIDMGNMDKDNALEFVTKGDKNNLIIYEFK